jgi:predicted ATPase
MEYVEGPDLRKVLRAAQTKHMRLPPYVVAYIIAEIAKGLHYAHERKDEGGTPLEIVHRDVSPQNILLSFEGAVKIADFGIATANLFREEPGVLKGKTAYMSPEQARTDKVDRRTDVYSLGVVFHELLTGRPLHGAAEGAELLEAVRSGQVEPPSTFARGIPPELEAIVMQALAKNTADRYQTGRELAAAITKAMFQKQEIVDSHVLETVLGELVSREHTSPGSDPEVDASLRDDSSASVADGHTRDADEATGPGTPLGAPRFREGAGREVRHVAVVTLRLHGLETLGEAIGPANAAHFLQQMRATLQEMAFKRGARWSWGHAEDEQPQSPLEGAGARAIVGLTANPARAAADAAWLAVDVHEAIHGACDDLPVEISSSVGIVRGIATGQRDHAGHLVEHELKQPADYLADMIGDLAPAGVTWVAGGLYRLLRRDFVWGDAPSVEIPDAVERGLPRNMRIYSLLRPLTRDERSQASALAPSDLVGRDAELADLFSAYYGVVGAGPGLGQADARVIFGEMGIGKTALVSTFLSELPPDARVLAAECSPAGAEVPFAGIAEWIRQLTGARADQPMEQTRTQIADALGSFAADDSAPEIVERLSELVSGRVAAAADEGDVAQNRQLIAEGLRRFFARAAADAPLVVVLDGVQWCDRQSLELSTEFIKRGEPLAVLVLLVTRPDERVAPHLEGLVRLELKGLSADNQIRLLQARLGVTEGVAHVCADLLPRAAGNPFFLLEMVDALLERGVLEIHEQPGGQQELIRVERPDDAGLALPSTLEQLIADRLGELPQPEQIVVSWLAVAGGPMPLSELTELNGEETDEVVARLCARGLCDKKQEVVDVRYPLTRDVAYLGLDRRQRSKMHRALAERLVDTPLRNGLTAAIVARHFARGGDRSRAAELYLEAGGAARSSYQTALATRYYRRVVGLLALDDLRGLEAHEALETICRTQGRWRERREHLGALRRLARSSGKPYWVTMALLRTAQIDLDAGKLHKALLSAERAAEAAARANSAVLEVQAQSLLSESLRDLGDMQGALAAVDRALEIASRQDVSTRLRAEVLRSRGTLLRRVGRVHEAVDAYIEAIAVFRQAGARRMEALAKNSLAFAMYVLGRFEDGVALALDAIQIDLAIGGRFQIAKTLATIGQCYAALGDRERGLAYLRRAREAHERYGDQDSRADTLFAIAGVLIEAGDLVSSETYVGDAGALTAVTGSAYDSAHEKIMRALLAKSSGDSGAAVMHAFDARQAAEAQAYVSFHFYAMAIEAAARVDIGEQHTGILLATTAMGAIETLQGSEYGLHTRVLCCDALAKAGSPQAEEMRRRAAAYVRRLFNTIRDPELRALFVRRRLVLDLLGTSPEAPPPRPLSIDGMDPPDREGSPLSS